jgi:hypothetical protein
MRMSVAVRRFKREYWTALLTRYDHNVTRAARVAGVNRTYAYKIIHALRVPHRWGYGGGHRGSWGKL